MASVNAVDGIKEAAAIAGLSADEVDDDDALVVE